MKTLPPHGPEAPPLPPSADGRAGELRGLRRPAPLSRDLWPAIAARLEPRACLSDDRTAHAPVQVPAVAKPARGPGTCRPPRLRRHHAGYAAVGAVVLAAGVFWQAGPGAGRPQPVPGPGDTRLAGSGLPPDAPLLHAADALAREYQGALREVQAATGTPGGSNGLDAELERNAAEVRAALARDPDALYLLQRLHRIYAHRLALNLRQA